MTIYKGLIVVHERQMFRTSVRGAALEARYWWQLKRLIDLLL